MLLQVVRIIILILPAFFISYQLRSQQFEKYFDTSTLRLDLLQSGNFFEEKINLAHVWKEPYWGGCCNKLIDESGYGNYYVKVYDQLTEELIYSRGFGSLFQEWRHIPDAFTQVRSFQLTVNVPFPLSPVRIEISGRDSMNDWHLLTQFIINPDTVMSKNLSFKKAKLLYNGKSSDCVDLVIVPDGYRKKHKGKMFRDAKSLSEWLLSYHPFIENRDKFNIWLAWLPSKENGCDDPVANEYKNTAIHTTFNMLGSDRYLMTDSIWKLHDVASVVPFDQIIIMVNSAKYGGGAIYNYYATVTAGNLLSSFVACHEFGHSFAGLADEYEGDSPYNLYFSLKAEPWEPNITTLVNFESKWKDLLDQDTPIPTPKNEKYINKIGVFEGAGYQSKGVYRPMMNCTMRSVSINNFCPVCKRAIVERINFYSN